MKVSTLMPGPPGKIQSVILPGDGVKLFSLSSALILNSIAFPLAGISLPAKAFLSPDAIFICSFIRSIPVTISVTGCST